MARGQQWTEGACVDCGGYIFGGSDLMRCPYCRAKRQYELKRKTRANRRDGGGRGAE